MTWADRRGRCSEASERECALAVTIKSATSWLARQRGGWVGGWVGVRMGWMEREGEREREMRRETIPSNCTILGGGVWMRHGGDGGERQVFGVYGR